ncbi:hypothetical protein ATY76_22310 [Rhizobium sp. R339]|uniref:hypothetical protein n=1 Tax=Rhizobium sp. R339 TaxID=1764273 RepID=UPI000B535000|nr:hypothetical protein [Rhizobium sp. R339]OWV64184.1 hypothetical protein ATY76_22310 [Rhizobium sp. R339]
MTEKAKTPTNDKRTIGITSANEKNLAALVLAGNFGSELDAAKFALAYAIQNDVSAGTAEGTNTKWNIGTVDGDGSLKSVVEAVFDGVTEPYRLIEYLINEGLSRLGSNDAIPPDVVGILFQADQRARSQDNKNGQTE